MKNSLKDRFYNLVGLVDSNLVDQMWGEIQDAHTSKYRVYHNLNHLENLFNELNPIQDVISSWETVSYAIFYHDIVYNVKKKNNEELSADLTVRHLKEINYPTESIQLCFDHIIATKSHSVSGNHDTNLFTDADLSVLGKDWNQYQSYFQAIRKEYKIYPNLLYNPARKKVLSHFLEMSSIFKTTHFRELYEQNARTNIERELHSL